MSGDHSKYAQFVRRVIRGYGKRVADADDVDLAEMVQLRDVLEQAIADAVRGQRDLHGRSWADVAKPLGVTRQAAQMRYAAKVGG